MIKENDGMKIKLNEEGTENEDVIAEIHFDNSQNRVYYVGQTVSGCVNLKFYQAKTVKGN